MREYNRLFIDGRWQQPLGQGMAEVIDPASEAVAGKVPLGNEADVERAVQAARRAFADWSRTPSSVRAGYIRALVDQLKARAEEMAAVITSELGMPVQWCRPVQVDGPIVGLEQYIELAGLMDEVREVGNSLVYREAVGVCAFINPWNYPLHQLIGKLAPALAAGCTVVVKPSQETPLHAFVLAEMIEAIGLPAGVFNLVSGPGSKVGEALARHPLVDMVSFTGSTGAGVRVSQAAAPSVKRVCLELGGKSPLLIGADADLDAAVRYGVQDVMINSGQTCTSSSRVLIQDTIYDEFTDRIAEKMKGVPVGHPLDPSSVIGPLIHPRHHDKVCSYKGIAEDDGATVIEGTPWAEAPEGGQWVTPMLFTNARNDMRIAQEEIFGPVLTAIPFTDEADAVKIGNDIDYGLAGYLWTRDVGRAHRVAEALDAGMIWVNSQNVRHLPAPFGGTKASGIGRDGGDWSFDFYMETKNISVALDTHPIPKLGG